MSLRPSISFLSGLLRTHVRRRAHQKAGLGDLGIGRLADRAGYPEVGDHGMALVQQNVLRFDVAMDHVVPVGVVQRLGDFAGDLERSGQPERRPPGTGGHATTRLR